MNYLNPGTIARIIPTARHNIIGDSGDIVRIASVKGDTCYCNPWSRSTRRRNRVSNVVGNPEGFSDCIQVLLGACELEPYDGPLPDGSAQRIAPFQGSLPNEGKAA